MKKFLVFLSVAIFIALTSFSQRVDIDRMYMRVKMRRLPDKVLSNEYNTFSVGISATISTERYTNQSYQDKINIVGFKHIYGNAHLNIKIKLDDLILEKTTVETRVEISKDKDGKETGRKYYHHAEVGYSFSSYATVYDYKTNNIIASYQLSRREEKKLWKSAEYDSYNGAADYYNNNKLEIKTSLLDEQINAALSTLNGLLNKEFGFPTDTDSPHIWYVDSKKHPEYQASQDNCNKIKNILNALIPEDSLGSAKKELADVIAYFEKLPVTYADPEEKAQKKVRYMAYFNLSTIYYYLDEPEKAIYYAQKIIDNDYDTGDGKRIIRNSDELAANFKRHNIFTLHFPIDLNNAEGPKL